MTETRKILVVWVADMNTTSNYVRLAYAALPGNLDKKHLSDVYVLKDRTSQIENDHDEKILERECLLYSRSIRKGVLVSISSYRFIDSL